MAGITVRRFTMYPHEKDGQGFLVECRQKGWQHWTRSRKHAEKIRKRWNARLTDPPPTAVGKQH